MQLFQYSTPSSLLQRLNRQFKQVEQHSTNQDLALDFCLTAWSLCDWVFYHSLPNGSRQAKGDFRKELFLLCPELLIMSDIANGIKHFELDVQKTNISSLNVDGAGAFDSSFDFSFDVPCIRINFMDGDWKVLNVIIQNVYVFWNGYISKTKEISPL